MNTSKETKTKAEISQNDLGIIIDGSHESADYINEETVDFAKKYGFDADFPEQSDEDYSQILSELGDEAVSYLNDNLSLPSYCSFFFEDNSLFCLPCIESAREDVDFVSSRKNEYPEDDYEGEWLHVNDHGNATLYYRSEGKNNEVWSLV